MARASMHGSHPSPRAGRPAGTLGVTDATALIIGVVVGAGIFRSPSLVAANVGSTWALVGAWLLGGAISLLGALCYAELASAFPDAGGEYHFLRRAYGRHVGFLFGWARLTIIQTGSIAGLAFVFGDYLADVTSPGNAYAGGVYAALCVALLTLLNLVGVQQGALAQRVLTGVKVLGLLLVGVAAITLGGRGSGSAAPAAPAGHGHFGLAMVFVLYTFGGWNEAAYVASELKDRRRGVVRSLVLSIGAITVLYLLANVAYLRVLGLAGSAGSTAIASEAMRQAAGGWGAALTGVLVATAALGATNATIFTGARAYYALGRDTPALARLGRWRPTGQTPAAGLIAQGLVTLALVIGGTLLRKGFQTMVDYTAPVFWFFFLLTGASLFVLRVRAAGVDRPFRVPLYPITPVLFCCACGFMLYSSVAYAGMGSLLGAAVLAAGVPAWLLCQGLGRRAHARTEEAVEPQEELVAS